MALKQQSKWLDNAIFIIYFALGVALGLSCFVVGNYTFEKNEILMNIFNTIGATFVIGSFFSLVYSRISRNVHYEDLKYLIEREDSGFRKIYNHTGDEDFRKELMKQMPRAKEIKMYGIGLNMLWEPHIYELLKINAERPSSSVKIIIADVDSPNIEMRHSEEAKCQHIVPKGKEFSKQVLKTILELEESIADKSKFTVATFNHYPTFAMLLIDSDIYVYQYGFKTVGTVSPVLHLRGYHSPQVRYYREQFELLEKEYLECSNAN